MLAQILLLFFPIASGLCRLSQMLEWQLGVCNLNEMGLSTYLKVHNCMIENVCNGAYFILLITYIKVFYHLVSRIYQSPSEQCNVSNI